MNARHAEWWVKHMGESSLSRWILLFIALIFGLPWTATGQTAPTNTTIVAVELARYVATEHVHANNQPYQWKYLDHLVLYDVDGNPSGYSFIFSKAESSINSSEDLRQHILTAMARKAQPSVEANTAADPQIDPFAFDDIATVITGATAYSPLIQRHFRGAPDFLVEAVVMEAGGSGGQRAKKTASQVIMMTPRDFRLVASDMGDSVITSRNARIAGRMPPPEDQETISVHSQKTERIAALRQQKNERETRERGRLATWKPEDQRKHEEALRERANTLQGQWDSKREAMQRHDAGGEGK